MIKAKWVWHNEKLPNLEKYEKLRIMTVTWNMAGRVSIFELVEAND